MKIAVDVMGGDNAPKAIIEGSIEAVLEYGIEIFLVGLKNEIKNFSGANFENSKVHIIEANEIINNDESPVNAVKRKKILLWLWV